MSLCGCNCKCSCTAAAFVISLLVGVIGAFLQITAVIALTPLFYGVLFGIAIVYLGLLVAVSASGNMLRSCTCRCTDLNTVLLGILGTILFSAILLAVDFAAASIFGAILVGLLLFSFTLTVTGSVCLVSCQTDCAE